MDGASEHALLVGGKRLGIQHHGHVLAQKGCQRWRGLQSHSKPTPELCPFHQQSGIQRHARQVKAKPGGHPFNGLDDRCC